MVGTFGGALEARKIDASNGKLKADVTGEVEQEEGVLVIKRVQVSMRKSAQIHMSGNATNQDLRRDSRQSFHKFSTGIRLSVGSLD
jgi:hypothetical protein